VHHLQVSVSCHVSGSACGTVDEEDADTEHSTRLLEVHKQLSDFVSDPYTQKKGKAMQLTLEWFF